MGNPAPEEKKDWARRASDPRGGGEKCAKGSGKIECESLTVEGPFLVELAKNGRFFSLEPLNALLRIRDALGAKASLAQRSLEKILGPGQGRPDGAGAECAFGAGVSQPHFTNGR